MKKTTKLKIKKVTLLNLDESKLDAMAGGVTTPASCVCTKVGITCKAPMCIYSVDACAA